MQKKKHPFFSVWGEKNRYNFFCSASSQAKVKINYFCGKVWLEQRLNKRQIEREKERNNKLVYENLPIKIYMVAALLLLPPRRAFRLGRKNTKR